MPGNLLPILKSVFEAKKSSGFGVPWQFLGGCVQYNTHNVRCSSTSSLIGLVHIQVLNWLQMVISKFLVANRGPENETVVRFTSAESHDREWRKIGSNLQRFDWVVVGFLLVDVPGIE